MIEGASRPIDRRSVQVIIPVLDEAGSIGGVIDRLRAMGLERIRVVDNGSRDGSPAVVRDRGVELLEEPRRGYGQACWSGLQSLDEEVEWILFCDGDGCDDLGAVETLLEAAPTADLILGNRRATAAGRAALTPAQNVGNGLATLLIALGWGHRYDDLGPLRLIRRSSLASLEMADRGFGWTVEMQTRALETGLRVVERPVAYARRCSGRSKISGTVSGTLRAGSTILSTIAVLFLARLKRWGTGLLPTPWRVPLSGALLLAGAWIARHGGPFPSAGEGWSFWLGLALMGLGYGISWSIRRISLGWFLGVTLLSRLLLLGMEPSDDIWRYQWEGLIQGEGFSPYDLPPDAEALTALRPAWWPLINHPAISSIYPPLAQWGFRLVAAFSPTVLAFKLAFTAADLGVVALLARRWGLAGSLLYAWNPLVLNSFAGEGHLDSWMILALVAAWLAFEDQRHRLSGLWLGLSLALKWISAPIGVFVLLHSPARRRAQVAVLLVIPLLISSLTFCTPQSCHLIPVDSGFISHQRSAELLPWILGGLWPLTRQANWPHALPLLLVLLLLLKRCRTFALFSERYLASMLILSPIVHGWYFTWLVPFSVVSRNLGTRLVSLSAFVYDLLMQRQAMGDLSWQLSMGERLLLWGPFLLGWLWTERQRLRSRPDAPLPASQRTATSWS